MASGRPPSPPLDNFETIYRWKGNLTASRIHFRYWKNILISRLYEQFWRNDSVMAPKWLSEKLPNFSIINMSYMALKHVIWRFQICNYFREIFKFRGFINFLRNLAKYVFAHIFAKCKYIEKQFILTESPDHAL